MYSTNFLGFFDSIKIFQSPIRLIQSFNCNEAEEYQNISILVTLIENNTYIQLIFKKPCHLLWKLNFINKEIKIKEEREKEILMNKASIQPIQYPPGLVFNFLSLIFLGQVC